MAASICCVDVRIIIACQKDKSLLNELQQRTLPDLMKRMLCSASMTSMVCAQATSHVSPSEEQ